MNLDEFRRSSLLKDLEVQAAQGEVRNLGLKGDLYQSQTNRQNAETNLITNPSFQEEPKVFSQKTQEYITQKNIEKAAQIQEELPKKQKYAEA